MRHCGGPSDLEIMFEVGSNIIEEVASAAESLSKAAPTRVRALEPSTTVYTERFFPPPGQSHSFAAVVPVASAACIQ